MGLGFRNILEKTNFGVTHRILELNHLAHHYGHLWAAASHTLGGGGPYKESLIEAYFVFLALGFAYWGRAWVNKFYDFTELRV